MLEAAQARELPGSLVFLSFCFAVFKVHPMYGRNHVQASYILQVCFAVVQELVGSPNNLKIFPALRIQSPWPFQQGASRGVKKICIFLYFNISQTKLESFANIHGLQYSHPVRDH